MILGIGTEAGVFLYAGLSGMTVLFAYQILSSVRGIVPHSVAATGIEDILFWVGASGYIFGRMYETTYGSIRWFFVLGVVCGAGAGWILLGLAAKICAKVKKYLEKYRKSR